MPVNYLQASQALATRTQQPSAWSRLANGFASILARFSSAPKQEKRRGFRQRNFDAAESTRSTDGWATNGASANAENWSAIKPVRERARDLKRNNSFVANGCRHVANIMIGDGIVPNCKAADPKMAVKANALWQKHTPFLDTANAMGIAALQRTAFDSMFCDGEILLRRRWRRMSDGLPVPMQVELLEADYLPEWKNENLENGGRIIQGIEFDRRGVRVAYHLYRQHPGDGFGPLGTEFSIERIPASEIAHGFFRDRPGQSRGVCQFASAVIPARNYDDCTFAWRQSARAAACVVGVVSTDQPANELLGTPDNESADSVGFFAQDGVTPLQRMTPASYVVARGGTQVSFNNPQAPQGVDAYMRSELHGIAAGMWNLPYALLSNDLSQTTYATWRADFAQIIETCENYRELFYIPTICGPVWQWFLEAAIASGELSGVPADYPVEWSTPKPFGFDRVEEATGSVKLIRAGLSSRQREIRRMGEDPEMILSEIAADKAAALKADLVFDSDANATNLAGAPRIMEKAVVPAPPA